MTKELRRERRELPCKLTNAELRQVGDQLAMTVQEIAREEDRQKSVRDEMKAKLTELQSRQTTLALKVSRREEYRNIEVMVSITDAGELVQEIRLDTNDIIRSRPASAEERQLCLDSLERNAETDKQAD